MGAGKWINNLTAATPVVEAARQVLLARLEAVRDVLPRAIHEPDQDVEHVHQLRVATRRARAALGLFDELLPGPVFRSARKKLRRIRRAAGEARDADVFQATLLAWTPSARYRSAQDFLLGYVRSLREQAQVELHSLDPVAGRFDGWIHEVVAAVDPPRGIPRVLGEFARPKVEKRLLALDEALAGPANDIAQLHGVRILGKKLRYAMEVFVGCFQPEFGTRLYPAVESLQEMLGALNDHRLARARLEALAKNLAMAEPGLWKRWQPGWDDRLRFHAAAIIRSRRAFSRWKSRWRRLRTDQGLLATR